MLKTKTTLLVFSILTTLLISCSEYQKVLKNSDYNLKYEKALVYYEKGDYYRAQSLFDELVSIFKGTDKSEKILYYYADCHYQQKDYVLGAYYFENFAKTFPYSEFTEKAAYTAAYCYYLNSPKYTLDQTDTRKAIEAMQVFINKYPTSTYVTEANDIIEKLRSKLELKSYESAKLYFKLGEYHAASIALRNSLKDFPDTHYREELLYLIVKSNFLLAENSVKEKQGERYQNTISEYYSFLDEFPESKYLEEIEKMYTKSVNQIKNL
ncbi:MAG: outer membrane protein assembly factor BamD [Salinivirgaceae bacterium]|nr:outer membrane protein assembly factor BamD [Salinivirgaceae bacterium]